MHSKTELSLVKFGFQYRQVEWFFVLFFQNITYEIRHEFFNGRAKFHRIFIYKILTLTISGISHANGCEELYLYTGSRLECCFFT